MMEEEIRHSETFINKITDKKNVFSVPENYFDNFSAALETKLFTESLPKDTGYIVPENYNFELKNINSRKTLIIRLVKISTIAASIFIGFGIFNFIKTKQHQKLEKQNQFEIINYLSQEEFTDTEEIISTHPDLSYNENSYKYSNEEINQYLKEDLE